MKYLLVGLYVLPFLAVGQPKYFERIEDFDVQKYTFELEVNDQDDQIQATAHIQIKVEPHTTMVILDLIQEDDSGKGMSVASVTIEGQPLDFTHEQNELRISIPGKGQVRTPTLSIAYRGVPQNGLYISKNIHGERTFFGDNWPNRARHWLPTVDHQLDKAFVEFVVTAPVHYQVVGTGKKVEEIDLVDGRRIHRWKSTTPLSTKVMVIGVARFAVQEAGVFRGIPVTSWAYPKDPTPVFTDFAYALKALDFFTAHVGPYPFSELANVESTTVFGGMENATNIFYKEGRFDGQRTTANRGLIVHEVAHQWFGNSATEVDWAHLWLSEGFATYFTNLFFELYEGAEVHRQRRLTQKRAVLAYAKERLAPVVDTETSDYMQLLNANSYQKGGWVLHMLRVKIGDDAFWEGIRTYYDRHALDNASTNDFKEVMEEVSGQDLTRFFDQWLYRAGHPKISIDWSNDKEGVQVTIKQTQKQKFDLSSQVTVVDASGNEYTRPVEMTDKNNFTFRTTFSEITYAEEIIFDAKADVLWEEAEIK